MTEINPLVWFGDRELSHVPKHFVRAPTILNLQSLFWVRTRLSGRYSCQSNYENSILFTDAKVIYFEDPSELTLYELRWAGVNIF